MVSCPCGSNKNENECCEVFITGKALPKFPEELMRSRYTAYSQANMNYIIETMKGSPAQNFDLKESENWAKHVTWLGLKVIQTKTEPPKGWVEFIAHYSQGNQKHFLHEKSEFHLENGKWFYVGGSTPKINRNDSCPCGSGKKFKKCCAS